MKQIYVLPDDVLLEIFDFYTTIDEEFYRGKRRVEAWQLLVHVCQRWRNLVFGSPRRLDLRLFCTPETPVRDTVDVWPALPLIVRGTMTLSDTDNIIAALGQSNRVCEVELQLEGWQLEGVLASMQISFPELTIIRLFSNGETLPPIPESFLDGSAPRLRRFQLGNIPFPGLPKLLSSATRLTSLELYDIPHSGYISPEAIVTLVSVLSSLESLSLEFRSPQSRPDRESRQGLSPPKHSILPALRHFYFYGVTEYLEELVTGIDTPQLHETRITFFNQIDFDCRRLAQFINREPKLRVPDEAHVNFNDRVAYVTLLYFTFDDLDEFEIGISCREPDWQLSSIEQVCNSSLHPLSTVQDLYIQHQYSELVWKDDAIESTLWLQLLLPFTSAINLYLSKEFTPGIAASLKELVGGRITEVLPSLQNIFVEALEPSGHFWENIGPFVAARQLSDHPVAISDRKKALTKIPTRT